MNKDLVRTPRSQHGPKYSTISNGLAQAKLLNAFWNTDSILPKIITPNIVGGEHNYQALKSHRDLREIIPGYSCADAEPDSFVLRVALLKAVSTTNGVVSLNAARWLYEGGSCPLPLEIFYPPYGKRPQGKLVVGRRKRIFQEDITVFFGLRVTSPSRTQKDLELDQAILAPVIR